MIRLARMAPHVDLRNLERVHACLVSDRPITASRE
jgi:hypothetical protein